MPKRKLDESRLLLIELSDGWRLQNNDAAASKMEIEDSCTVWNFEDLKVNIAPCERVTWGRLGLIAGCSEADARGLRVFRKLS